MVCYRKATLEDLNRVWDYQMAQNPDEPRNQRWRDSFISRNLQNRAATYVAVYDGEPVGEVTLDYFADGYGNPELRPLLADGTTTSYVTALRIRKEYEGKGYISGLMACMETCAKEMGFTHLTIGVEAAETRNISIYLHWGYTQFINSEVDCGELVLFYQKTLISDINT